jgi:hypothetical protein
MKQNIGIEDIEFSIGRLTMVASGRSFAAEVPSLFACLLSGIRDSSRTE